MIAQAGAVRTGGLPFEGSYHSSLPVHNHRLTEIHLPTLFFDAIDGVKPRHVCLTPGTLKFTYPSRSLGNSRGPPKSEYLTIHSFGTGFGDIPGFDNLTIHFQSLKPEQHPVPGQMGARLVALFDASRPKSLFTSSSFKKIKVVEPKFPGFTETERLAFEREMDKLFTRSRKPADQDTTLVVGNGSAQFGIPTRSGTTSGQTSSAPTPAVVSRTGSLFGNTQS